MGCPSAGGVVWSSWPTISVCVACSLNVNRYPPTNYDQVHLHPHLFPEQSRVSPSNYSPSAGTGFSPAQQALKVPQLDQFPSFSPSAQQQQHYTASALQQALLSPTPPDYSRHQQVPHILQGLLSPRHSLTGHTDMRLPQAEFAQLIKRRQQQQQQQQQELQELLRHMSQGDAGSMGASLGQNLPERQSLSLPYQNADAYPPHSSPQHLLKIRVQECIQQVPASVPHGYAHQPALVHSESMEEDCACEGGRDGFPDSKSSNALTKGCHESPLLLNAGGQGDPDSVLGTASPAQELGTHHYRHQPAAGFSRSKVPSRGKPPCCRARVCEAASAPLGLGLRVSTQLGEVVGTCLTTRHGLDSFGFGGLGSSKRLLPRTCRRGAAHRVSTWS